MKIASRQQHPVLAEGIFKTHYNSFI